MIFRTRNPLPLAGEGGSKRRMRVYFRYPALVATPHPNPLPQAGEGANFGDARD